MVNVQEVCGRYCFIMKQQNLLIVHHGALGDLVATFPIIIRLKEIYCQIDIICQITLGKLAQTLHIIETYFPLESALFASLFTDTVDPTAKSILCAYEDVLLFSNSVQLEDSIGNTTRKPVYRIQPRPGIKSNLHITEHILSQLDQYERFGCIDTTPHSILLSPAHPDHRNSRYDPLKVMLHPGSGSFKKCWPISNFIKLASLLRSKGQRTEFILGPAEQSLAEALEKQGEHKSNIHEVDSLARLTTILKTAGSFVGNDSGVSHLSAFLGLPTVVVFGPSNPRVWRPIGRSVRIVRPDLDCHPCFETNNNHCKNWECFDRTTPETVLDALMENISRDRNINLSH